MLHSDQVHFGQQFLIFILTSFSTLLGAFGYAQWIPVILALGAVCSSCIAYMHLEGRMERVNTAIVSLRKLMVGALDGTR